MRLSMTVTGIPEIRARLKLMNPAQNQDILRKGFIASALAIQVEATKNQIKSGGGGKNNASPPLPDRLTSRTGTLRRSIAVDRGPLPFAIEVGTDLGYGAFHEFHARRLRPFMQPALDKVAPRIPSIFVAEWKKEGRL